MLPIFFEQRIGSILTTSGFQAGHPPRRLVNYQLEHFAEFDGEVFNVGGGLSNSLSLVEATDLCQKIAGKSIPINPVLEERPGDIPIFITDSSRVMEKTGWQPVIGRKRLCRIFMIGLRLMRWF